MKLRLTLAEIMERWGFSDHVCSVLKINPYCLAEGQDKETIKEFSPRQATRIGMLPAEIKARQVEGYAENDEDNPGRQWGPEFR